MLNGKNGWPFCNTLSTVIETFGNVTYFSFIVLFCFSKKEPKKEPRNRIQPDFGKQLCSASYYCSFSI